MARGYSEIWENLKATLSVERRGEGWICRHSSDISKLNLNISMKKEMGGDKGQISGFFVCLFFLLEVKIETKCFTGKTFLPSLRGYQPYKSNFWSTLPKTLVPKLLRKLLVFSKYTIIFLSLSQNSDSWSEDGPPSDFAQHPANLSPNAN